MRRDENLFVFIGHAEWYTLDLKRGYIPTKEAPPEAVKAMKAYNSYGFKK